MFIRTGALIGKTGSREALIREGVGERESSDGTLHSELGRGTPTLPGLLSPTGCKCVARASVMPKPGSQDQSHAVTSCLAGHEVKGFIPSSLYGLVCMKWGTPDR